MTYPKPLSSKSLARLYAQSGLSEEQMDFLRIFVDACVNLYGAFFANEAWEVYKQFATVAKKVVRIQRKQLFEMLTIMRREPDNSFYVFEVDEVYGAERRSLGAMIVARKELIGPRNYKYFDLYELLENSFGKPFFVPENLLDYAEMPENPYEAELLHELGELKSTMKMVPDSITGELTKRCKYTGKKLKEFSYVSEDDETQLDFAKGKYGNRPHPEEVAKIKARIGSVNAAQRIVNQLKWRSNLGLKSASEFGGDAVNEMIDMGVDFDNIDEINKILQLIGDMNNNQHLWSNHGWTPEDMMKYYGPAKNPKVSIGPGLKELFDEGLISKEEYVRELEAAGFEVIDEDLE